ncbi:MAG: ABC transporter permease [Prevotellaceae bacterium]|jgi:putative ABC transport system permease protein|nr:ABC transporter permease [Prevotellaceae bacterium]
MNNIFNLKTFFFYLKKNKVYAFINVFGLTVSLIFVILIAVYVNRELSVDRFHRNGDRIYVLGNDKGLDYAYRIAYRIQQRYPEIEKVCPVIPWYYDNTGIVGENKFITKLLFVDSTFFDFFDFKLYGNMADAANVLASPNSAVISRTFARKAFGNGDPVGQFIRLSDNLSVTVTGITEDINNSTVPYGDILVRIDNIRHFNQTMDSKYFANSAGAYIFVMEKENADLRAKTEDITAFFKEIFWKFKSDMLKSVNLTPLKQAYFSELRGYMLQHGDRQFVTILSVVGLAILLFALTNYINLTVAQTGFRASEVAVRRLFGASRGELFARMIMESTVLCLISFVLAMYFAYILTPYAGDLLNSRHLSLNEMWTPAGTGISLLTVLILGTVSGLLPAMIISKVKPIDITKGSMKRKTKMVFSRYFIIFQHTITLALLVSAITITSQTQHLINAPLGYNTENILQISTFNFENSGLRDEFFDEAGKLASVKRIAYASGTPHERGNNNTFPHKGKMIPLQILIGDSAYVQMLGLKILRENHQENAYYLSQYAVKYLEIEEDALEFVSSDGNYKFKIAGIVQDFRLGTVTDDIYPIAFKLGRDKYPPWSILVEVQGDPSAAYRQVRQTYERISGMSFTGEFISEQIAEKFARQRQISQIMLVFTGIAVLISILGLLAMSTYFIRLRTKEIAVRKVFGASFGEVLLQLLRIFLTYVVAAFVIAVPFSWYLMRTWLDDFSYRISLSPWIFIAAGVFCFIVSLVTVFWQSRIAANANPIDSMKAL